MTDLTKAEDCGCECCAAEKPKTTSRRSLSS
jgi:hypothetical protein